MPPKLALAPALRVAGFLLLAGGFILAPSIRGAGLSAGQATVSPADPVVIVDRLAQEEAARLALQP